MQLTRTEENYIKLIHELPSSKKDLVATTILATCLQTTPAAVTDMIQRLHQKGLAIYQKHQGVKIAPIGEKKAIQLLRKQRLWEVFLVTKLKFDLEEAASIAGELEHIHSDSLIERLETYLDNPVYNPVGKPIPDKEGQIKKEPPISLDQLEVGIPGTVVAIKDETELLVTYLEKKNIQVGIKIVVIEKNLFDESVEINIGGTTYVNLSEKVNKHIFVVPFKN